MKRALRVCLVVAAVAAVTRFAAAQDARRDMTARFAALIEEQLAGAAPIRLRAERITLTGSDLKLSGSARFEFAGTVIRADEALVHQDTDRVELIGNVSAMLSPAAARTVGMRIPRTEYK